MEMKLELVPLPVSDVEQSKTFYLDVIGFTLDHDVQPGNGMRIIQMTPPGSACSIAFGTGTGNNEPEKGTVHNLHLVVSDIAAARQQLLAAD
jgi:predicted enzyme related to lactoylglutathione lyase